MAHMEVILLERVAHVGQMGDVVKVKPGFARNFLLPQKKAERWVRAASQLQTRLGAERDLQRAIALLQEQGADAGLADFLRGVAAASRHG